MEQERALAFWHVLVNSLLQHSVAWCSYLCSVFLCSVFLCSGQYYPASTLSGTTLYLCWCRAECVVVVMACNLMTNISYLPTVHPYITPQPHRTYSLLPTFALRLHFHTFLLLSLQFATFRSIMLHFASCNIPIDAITLVRFATH